jgi:hypothetical protein
LLSSSRVPNFVVRELFWFGLRVVGILQRFYSQAVFQRTIVDIPAFFGDWFCRKDCGLCTHNPSAKEVGGLEIFLNEPAQDFELHLKIQDQNLKNQKPLALNVLSEAYPMVPLSCRSNLARRYLVPLIL